MAGGADAADRGHAGGGVMTEQTTILPDVDASPAPPPLAEQTVRVIDVKRVYRMGGEEVHALKGVSISINRGEYISIMGPSGSGKSTLFNMIGGLDKPTEGKVYIDEVDIAQLDSYELAWMRCRKIGYIFQTFNLIPVMSALENVMLPMIFAGLNTADAQERAAEILKRVELGHRLMNKPSEMSGGQQQRVAIARAFANDPAIILADEPTGNLDLQTGKLIIELLHGLNREKGVTIISATHDHKMLSVSDRIIWIRDGRVDKIQKRADLKIAEGTIEGAGGEDLKC
jgi:putative ABC transport system ATP-binding protein